MVHSTLHYMYLYPQQRTLLLYHSWDNLYTVIFIYFAVKCLLSINKFDQLCYRRNYGLFDSSG